MAIRYRRFGEDENQRVCKLFARGLNALLTQAGEAPYVDVEDPAAWAVAWERDRRSLFEHLAAGEGERWLAEENGVLVGYARSIVRGAVRHLLARGFRMNDKFVQFLMADTPRPCLDRYIVPSPGFFW
jgi:hypothetical protein